jgi:hypothetical protein
MKQIRLLATHVLCTTLVVPRLAAAQTVPAIPPSDTTPHQVESRSANTLVVMRLRWRCMSRMSAAPAVTAIGLWYVFERTD